MSDSYVIRKERCPLCAKEGKDTNGDNLAVYSDGHSFCYGSHGLVMGVSGYQVLKNHKPPENKKEVCLPSDCDINYPIRALQWVEKYELGRNDLLNHNVFWSEYKQSLIFPVWQDGELKLYSTRYFGEDKKEPKSKSVGSKKGVFHLLGKGDKIVLVEDIISAIKISRTKETEGCMAMPLYGSFVGLDRFKRLYKMFGKEVEVLVWLDPDKRKESIVEANRGALCGLKCRTIFSDKDPKEHTGIELKKLLKN